MKKLLIALLIICSTFCIPYTIADMLETHHYEWELNYFESYESYTYYESRGCLSCGIKKIECDSFWTNPAKTFAIVYKQGRRSQFYGYKIAPEEN